MSASSRPRMRKASLMGQHRRRRDGQATVDEEPREEHRKLRGKQEGAQAGNPRQATRHRQRLLPAVVDIVKTQRRARIEGPSDALVNPMRESMILLEAQGLHGYTH